MKRIQVLRLIGLIGFLMACDSNPPPTTFVMEHFTLDKNANGPVYYSIENANDTLVSTVPYAYGERSFDIDQGGDTNDIYFSARMVLEDVNDTACYLSFVSLDTNFYLSTILYTDTFCNYFDTSSSVGYTVSFDPIATYPTNHSVYESAFTYAKCYQSGDVLDLNTLNYSGVDQANPVIFHYSNHGVVVSGMGTNAKNIERGPYIGPGIKCAVFKFMGADTFTYYGWFEFEIFAYRRIVFHGLYCYRVS